LKNSNSRTTILSNYSQTKDL